MLEGGDIWTIPAAGGSPVAITNDSFLDWNPVWSPDGGSLYFSSDRGGSVNLWRVTIDERSGKRLGPSEPITTPAPYSGYISVSRDGTRIAYAQQVRTVNLTRIGFDPVTEMPVGPPIQITQGLKDLTTPRFSPDGQWVVFYNFGKRESLFVVRSDGTGLRQLTDDEYRHRGPRWSPDGKHIGVFSNRSGRSEIWRMNPDGIGLERLTDFGCNFGPIWSPDGTRFVCSRLSDGTPVIVEVGTLSEKVALARSPGDDYFRVNDWSPDGRSLAGGNLDLWP